jgi:hypothetical protein
MNKFLPLNNLESSLLAAKRTEISIGEFVQKLISSDLVMPTAKEVQADGSEFEPVLFDKNGTKMLALFTDKERVKQVGHIAKYCLVMKGLDVLRRIPLGHGVVVNPGLDVGFELSPEGVVKIVNDMS